MRKKEKCSLTETIFSHRNKFLSQKRFSLTETIFSHRNNFLSQKPVFLPKQVFLTETSFSHRNKLLSVSVMKISLFFVAYSERKKLHTFRETFKKMKRDKRNFSFYGSLLGGGSGEGPTARSTGLFQSGKVTERSVVLIMSPLDMVHLEVWHLVR